MEDEQIKQALVSIQEVLKELGEKITKIQKRVEEIKKSQATKQSKKQ